MRLKISENMPWYAAIFGGIPVIDTVVLEKLFEDSIENIPQLILMLMV